MEVNGYLQMSAYQLLNILFVCVQQKTETRTGLVQYESEYMTIFIFG